MDGIDMPVVIYALIDPRDDRVMYVGQTVDPDGRYRQHCSDVFLFGKAKAQWIAELKSLGLVPRFQVVQRSVFGAADRVEKELIRSYKAQNQCSLNRAEGGLYGGVVRPLNATQEEWFQLGRKVKQVRSLLLEIGADVERMVGKNMQRKMAAILRSFDMQRMFMEGTIRQHFPEWKELTRVFYGPEEDL